jgi:hypothetical protein
MSDDKDENLGLIRVNVDEEYELAYWCKKWGVTPQQLHDAVKKVGPIASKVREELGK